MDKNLIPFDENKIRKIWHNEEWYFSIVDVVEALTNSPLPRQYWTKVKKDLTNESQSYPFWIQLKLMSNDNKNYKTDCANTEGVFRIIMAIPSPKAEPIKLWLAKAGKQILDETENPEIGFERLKEVYRAKGYDEKWIETRMKSITTRKLLTDEWSKRDVKEGHEYAILTATIARGTFGITPKEHSKLKGLEKQNLRDHMTNLELLFSAIGEEATRINAVDSDAQGFNENLESAQSGGKSAGRALKAFEEDKKIKVVSSNNFLGISKNSENDPPTLPEAPKI